MKKFNSFLSPLIQGLYVIVSFIRYLRKRGKTDIREPEIPKIERSSYIPHAFTGEVPRLHFHHLHLPDAR